MTYLTHQQDHRARPVARSDAMPIDESTASVSRFEVLRALAEDFWPESANFERFLDRLEVV